MYVNDVLPDRMQVRPLKEGEKVIYRLVGAGRLDPKTKTPIFAAGLSLKGKTMVKDKKTGTMKLIMNVAGYRPIEMPDGTIRNEPIPGRVVFGKSNDITVTSNDPELYGFLERHNANESNPHRDTGRRALFFRVDTSKIAEKKILDEDLELEARLYVRDADLVDLKPIIKAFKISENLSPEEMKYQLLQKAKRNPLGVINASAKKDLKHKVWVHDAFDNAIVSWDEEERIIAWNLDDNMNDILRVEVGQKPKETMVEFLSSTEGKSTERLLVKALKQFGLVASN